MSASPVVTEEWCRSMGMKPRRRQPPHPDIPTHPNWIVGGDRFILGIEFSPEWISLYVEDHISGESVVVCNNPTQGDVEFMDAMNRREILQRDEQPVDNPPYEETELDYLKRAIEYAPKVASDLLGWQTPRDSLFICSTCAGRILARGCALPRGSTAVWLHHLYTGKCCLTEYHQ